ncbi:Peptidyl-prolyl isomerase cwc27 [Neolecta irregularis DAH-3]|uniref:Peptidyl-prolyl isomerase CWC27 n=1 Tax=Neolecta irregularis (strain DAH-3) TaxID=1198029 RepID=A0A1U7LMZ6_NEOID|nr:Peptidyl-prolyl isomerase cwc27 [Neolecta irregularis DAH-3]|eukprot:OLL23998.1 Peptidyl-prolyl isomerase cwc27 [Neolecta irregularis DAH-3]
MTAVVIQEPFTEGKVLLSTTKGDIEIELWPKQAPKAVRNFVQLCLEGYYNSTVFHRLVPSFILQGGDPTGTGTGGQSIYDEPFPDEFHSRLRYSRRGLVGMASSGPSDNGSQFFITLAATPELQGKNTLFGRVMGDTIFNIVKMGEADVEGERPLYPVRIIKSEVLWNPFEDIVPRISEPLPVVKEKGTKKKGKKNKALLSFEDETEKDVVTKKIVSMHDVGDDPRLVKETAHREQKERPHNINEVAKLKPESKETTVPDPPKSEKMEIIEVESNKSPPPKRKQKLPGINDLQAQIDAMKNSIRSLDDRTVAPSDLHKEKKKSSYLDLEREKYKSGKAIIGRKRKKPGNEAEILSALESFRSKLQAPSSESSATPEISKFGEVCPLHLVPGCMSCFDRLGETNDNEDLSEFTASRSWLNHSLTFGKDYLGKDGTYKMQREMENYEVIDPRERKAEARRKDKESRKSDGISRSFRKEGGWNGRKND